MHVKADLKFFKCQYNPGQLSLQLFSCECYVLKKIAMEGSLSKWTNVMKGWQYRWFVLDDNSGLLSYYTVSRESMKT